MADHPDLNWLVWRTVQEVGRELLRLLDSAPADLQRRDAAAADLRTELQRFQQSLEQLSESDLAIYGAALAGLEDTLMSPEPFHYQSVLDHLIQNIGGLLDDLGCFDVFGGDLPTATLDLGWAASVRARVDLDVAIPLEQTRRRLWQTTLAPLFQGQNLVLAIQHLYRPRLLRAPEPDDWCYGLAGRDRTAPRDVTLIVTRALPETTPMTQAELPVVVQRTRLRDLLFGSLPGREEAIPRLKPADFVHLLHGLLLDARDYCYRRAHDRQQLEQLNRLLFRLLARSGSTPGGAASGDATT